MCKGSDAANFAMPRRSHEVFPLSEKVNVLDLIKKKKSYAEVAKIYGKNKFSLWNCEEGKVNFCYHISDCKTYGHSTEEVLN